MYLFIYSLIYLFIYLYIYLSFHLFIYSFIYLIMYLFICIIYLFIHATDTDSEMCIILYIVNNTQSIIFLLLCSRSEASWMRALTEGKE